MACRRHASHVVGEREVAAIAAAGMLTAEPAKRMKSCTAMCIVAPFRTHCSWSSAVVVEEGAAAMRGTLFAVSGCRLDMHCCCTQKSCAEHQNRNTRMVCKADRRSADWLMAEKHTIEDYTVAAESAADVDTVPDCMSSPIVRQELYGGGVDSQTRLRFGCFVGMALTCLCSQVVADYTPPSMLCPHTACSSLLYFAYHTVQRLGNRHQHRNFQYGGEADWGMRAERDMGLGRIHGSVLGAHALSSTADHSGSLPLYGMCARH